MSPHPGKLHEEMDMDELDELEDDIDEEFMAELRLFPISSAHTHIAA